MALFYLYRYCFFFIFLYPYNFYAKITFMKDNFLKNINIKKILDITIIILLFITLFKRGGFYKSDVLLVNLIITAIGIIYFAITTIIYKKNRISIVSILCFLLGMSYFFPILFNNYSDMSDSIFEMIRYFNLYIIYVIVSNSENKKVYENGIIIVTLIECIIGIDGISNRYLSNFLRLFNTGFYSKDLIRMSTTIQYANIFACLCAVSLFFIIFNLKKYIDDKKKIKIFYLSSYFIIFSSIILTESRAVLLLYILFLILYFVLNRKDNNMKKIVSSVILNTIYSIIYVIFVNNFSINIYLFTILFVCFNIVLNYIICKYDDIFLKINYIKVGIISGVIMVIYILVAINIDIPLTVRENSVINLYENENGKINNLKFRVDESQNNTMYVIKISEVFENLEVNEIRNVGYFSTSTGKFDIDFNLSENVKYIKLDIECENGSITLNDMILNGKEIKLNYLLIPNSIVYRIKDILNGSTSIADRVIFAKDAISIIKDSFKNFFIGIGGEGFKNTYEIYQTQKYVSTEVHNSFLQIFVESGIFGFLCMTAIIVYTVIKCKNKNMKFLLLFFVCHSLIDLELSYFSMIVVYAIILGLCDVEKINLNRFFNIIPTLVLCVIFYILLKANIACNIQVNDTFTITRLEGKISLDYYDKDYRLDLNSKYMDLLKDENLSYDRMDEIVKKIKENTDILKKNSKFDKYVLIEVCDMYLYNLDNFVRIYYPLNAEDGYNYYLNYILENISELQKHKYNEVAIEECNRIYNEYLSVLKEKNR